MSYHYLEHIATADIGFEASASSLADLIVAGADALMNVMVEDLESIQPGRCQTVSVESDSEEMLLFEALQELVFLKDAHQLLLRLRNAMVNQKGGLWHFEASACGEEIDTLRHDLNADVKAVTMHRFRVERTSDGWRATVILDI